MFNIVSIGWNNRQKNWSIYTDRCKIKSTKKNIIQIFVLGYQKNIYIHKGIFDFLKIYYKTDEDDSSYTNINWAAASLDECIFFIEDEKDTKKGVSYFYRTLEFLEETEQLKGNKLNKFVNRSVFSHGFFDSIFTGNEK